MHGKNNPQIYGEKISRGILTLCQLIVESYKYHCVMSLIFSFSKELKRGKHLGAQMLVLFILHEWKALIIPAYLGLLTKCLSSVLLIVLKKCKTVLKNQNTQ